MAANEAAVNRAAVVANRAAVADKAAAAANRAAGDRAAANPAANKTGFFETKKRREVTPAAFVISRNSLCV